MEADHPAENAPQAGDDHTDLANREGPLGAPAVAGHEPGVDYGTNPAVEGEPAVAPPAAAATDISLPISAVTRVFKAKLPPGTVISKEAKASACKAAQLFVMYLTTTASDISRASKRSTVTGPDVVRALGDIDMPEFAEAAGAYLSAFKSQHAKARASKRSGDADGASAKRSRKNQ